VWTTGATMRECTKVLKRKGAKEVWGLVVAR
jgi:predicted amidophosphoribosyltransferase